MEIGDNMRFLPDGTVEIRNKKTGETKIVKPNELPNYGISYGTYKTELEAAKSVQTPTPLEIIKEPTETQQKEVGKYQDVSNNLDLLLENYGQVKDKGPIAGRSAEFFSSITKGASNPDVADYEALRKAMIGPLARTISGEVGVLTDRDISRAEGLLPKISDDPKAAQKKVENLKKIIGQKVDTPSAEQFPPESIISAPQTSQISPAFQRAQENMQTIPTTQQPISSGDPIMDFIQRARTGTGTTKNKLEPNFLADMLLGRAANIQRKQNRGEQVSTDERIGAAGQAINRLGQFTPGLGMLFKAGVGGAIEGATTPGKTFDERAKAAGLQGGGQLATAGILKGLNKVVHPFRTVGEMKQAAVAQAQGKTVSGDKIYSNLEKAADRLSPTVKQGYKKFLEEAKSEFVGQNIPIDKATDLASNANDAYTAAGKVGKAASAKFNNVLAQSLKEQIKLVAPKVSKANDLFRMLYGAQRGAGKIVIPTAIGAGASAGIYALLNKLGVGR